MNAYRSFAYTLLSVVILSGCTTSNYLRGKESKDYTASLKLDATTASSLGFANDELSAQAAIATAMRSGDNDTIQATFLTLVSTSDKACEKYMSGMITASNSVTSSLNITGLALSSAASLTSPTRSANLLSGLSTFAGGTEKQLSDTVLGGKAPPLLYRAVMALRKKERSKIATLVGQNQFALAAVELEPYHAQCGPTIGINALDESVENSSQNALEDGFTEAMTLTSLAN